MEKREVSRTMWKIIVLTPILFGLLIFSVFNSTFFIPMDYYRLSLLGSGGATLIGVGFGLAYARYFKIKGID